MFGLLKASYSVMDFRNLDVATHNTEILLITGFQIPLIVDINIGNEITKTKNSLKYLGIRLDPRLIFADQIQYLANKARKIEGNFKDSYF